MIMKKNLFACLVFLCIFQHTIWAQQQQFTMKEAVLGLSTTLAPFTLKQLKWMGNDTKQLAHIVEKDGVESVIKTSIPDCSTEILFSLPKLNEAIAKFGIEPLKKIPTLNWQSDNYFYSILANNIGIGCKIKNGSIKADTIFVLPAEAENIIVHPSSMNVAYVQNHNLYIKTAKHKTIQVTQDGSYDLEYAGGKVHQDEFGMSTYAFWSEDGDHIAFYKMNQSMVTDYPIIDWNATPAKVNLIKYPFAGQKSHEVKLLTYNLRNGKTAEMDTRTPADQYLTCVTWHPDNEHIYIGLLNRDQNDLSINKYDASNGQFLKTLLNEQHPKYVEPQHPIYFIPEWKDAFVYWSQKDGFMHLYKVDEETSKQTQLTFGRFNINEWIGYNFKNKEILFTSSQEGAMNKQLFALDVMDKQIRKLNTVMGWHTVTANQNNTYVIDEFTNTNEPKAIDIIGIEGDYEKRLSTAKNTLTNYAIAKVTPVTLYSADLTKLHGRMMLPADFDANKKYPVIVYLYNGPHVQLIKNTFPESGNLWYDYLTQHGYIVFTMDGRGSGNRGFEFESATFGKLGTVEMEDQMVGVKYLQSLPYVDKDKMGIHGWSFGGFMATSFMLRMPDVFKVAVAGGPVMDWSKYEIMYTERYMDDVEKNKKGYDDNNLLTKTDKLKGKLLLIHGTDDDVVVWQHSLAFIKKCVDNNQQVDYFVYPGYQHNVRGKDRVHLMQKITDYFDEHLKK
jgi:dipeptidyl-peptidase 4